MQPWVNKNVPPFIIIYSCTVRPAVNTFIQCLFDDGPESRSIGLDFSLLQKYNNQYSNYCSIHVKLYNKK